MDRTRPTRNARCHPAASGIALLLALSGPVATGNGRLDPIGPYQVGHLSFDAVDAARDDRILPTEVWYPVAPDFSGAPPLQFPLRYSANDVLEIPSPFLDGRGGFEEAPVSSDGPFPLVLASHGNTATSLGLGYLGESLASHGYVVAIPIGNILSLEWFQAISNGKSRFKVSRLRTPIRRGIENEIHLSTTAVDRMVRILLVRTFPCP